MKFNYKIFIILISLFFLKITDLSAQSKKPINFLNKKAPELNIETWISEKPELQNKFILIDFWATWCTPCKVAMKHLNDFQKLYKDELAIIGLSHETPEKIRKMKYPVISYYSASDTQERLKKELNIKAIPYVIVIDPKGIIRWQGNPLRKDDVLDEYKLEDLFKKYND